MHWQVKVQEKSEDKKKTKALEVIAHVENFSQKKKNRLSPPKNSFSFKELTRVIHPSVDQWKLPRSLLHCSNQLTHHLSSCAMFLPVVRVDRCTHISLEI